MSIGYKAAKAAAKNNAVWEECIRIVQFYVVVIFLARGVALSSAQARQLTDVDSLVSGRFIWELEAHGIGV